MFGMSEPQFIGLLMNLGIGGVMLVLFLRATSRHDKDQEKNRMDLLNAQKEHLENLKQAQFDHVRSLKEVVSQNLSVMIELRAGVVNLTSKVCEHQRGLLETLSEMHDKLIRAPWNGRDEHRTES